MQNNCLLVNFVKEYRGWIIFAICLILSWLLISYFILCYARNENKVSDLINLAIVFTTIGVGVAAAKFASLQVKINNRAYYYQVSERYIKNYELMKEAFSIWNQYAFESNYGKVTNEFKKFSGLIRQARWDESYLINRTHALQGFPVYKNIL